MPRLLFIEASPRKARSATSELANELIHAYRSKYSNAFVDHLDLWAKPLPEFDQAALDAKYAVLDGTTFTAPQRAAWNTITTMIDRLKAADVVVFSVPMWNFSIPYKLKHYLDLVLQPGLSFGHDAERGYFGLVNDKKAVCVFASGGEYKAGTPEEAIDFQSKYLHFALGFIGITERHEVRVAPTLQGQARTQEAKAQAKTQLQAIVDQL